MSAPKNTNDSANFGFNKLASEKKSKFNVKKVPDRHFNSVFAPEKDGLMLSNALNVRDQEEVKANSNNPNSSRAPGRRLPTRSPARTRT